MSPRLRLGEVRFCRPFNFGREICRLGASVPLPDREVVGTEQCYDVHATIDTEHSLIIAHDVVQVGNDRGQLAHAP